MEGDLIPTGRVFAAVVPPAEAVAELVHRMEGISIPGRPVPPPNWHVTLRFVGHIDQVPYERWLAALDQAPLPGPFEVRVGGFGAFPRPARATVLWLGVEGDGLASLAAVVDDAAAAASLGHEERPFRAHLTLARIRPPQDVRGLTEDRGGWSVRFLVDRFHIMAAAGSRYRVYADFPL